VTLVADELLFDLIMATALVAVAWTSLSSRDLFKAVVIFIAFGLLMAIAWMRLGAPDIGLAEAAIGAGVTGALLLDAVRQMSRSRG
jgi:energy-converting hydrogenase B subunit D